MPEPALDPVDAVSPVALGHREGGVVGGDITYGPDRRFSGDAALRYASLASALGVLVLLLALLFVLTRAALPSIRATGWSFLTTSEWRANELSQPKRDAEGGIVEDDAGETVMETIPPTFGALPTIYGTAVSSAIALIFAVPLSLGTALFLVRAAPKWLAPPASFLVEFLAAIPSIAFGMWGLFVLAPFLQAYVEPVLRDGPTAIDALKDVPVLNLVGGLGSVPGLAWLFQTKIEFAGRTMIRPLALGGRDMFCGGLVLAVMIVPIITAVARDILRQVPRIQIEGTLALGATWWQSCREMLRYSRSALFGAIMLGLARAAGETMAVTMVIGNSNRISASPFAPAQTMSSLLANEFAEAGGGLHRAALSEVALVLLVMSLLFNIIARQLVVGKDARTSAAA